MLLRRRISRLRSSSHSGGGEGEGEGERERDTGIEADGSSLGETLGDEDALSRLYVFGLAFCEVRKR